MENLIDKIKKYFFKENNTKIKKEYSYEIGKDTHLEYTKSYLKILDTYQNKLKKSYSIKNKLKKSFFNMIRCIMSILIILFIISIIVSFYLFYKIITLNPNPDSNFNSVIAGAITAIISSFSTMIASIIILPKIIADYLYDKEEDKLMHEIMKDIQKYELKAFNQKEEGKEKANEIVEGSDSLVWEDLDDTDYIEPETSNSNINDDNKIS